MRREQIHKICLNHVLSDEIEYKTKDEKAVSFVANDFSEGKVELVQFCLRFKTPEIVADFRAAVDKALSGGPDDSVTEAAGADGDSKTVSISEEDKRLADSLMLPTDFFAYKSGSSSCTGCRECQTPEFNFPEVKQLNLDAGDDNPLPLTHPVSRARRAPPKTTPTTDTTNTSVFGGIAKSNAGLFGTANTNVFGGSPSTNIFGNQDKPLVFGNVDKPSVFGSGQKSFFGGTGNTENGPKPLPATSFSFGQPIESPFQANNKTDNNFSFKATALFGQAATLSATPTNDVKPMFGGNVFKSPGK